MGARRAVLAALAALAAGQGPARERPRDPWVFRTRCAGVESALVVALHRELWLAYDPRRCALVRAWHGGDVGLGAADAAPARWLDGTPDGVWWLVRGEEALAMTPRWRGYVLRDGQVTLRYELRVGEVAVTVEETPELVRPRELADDPAAIAPWVEPSMVGLRRAFRASGVPEGASVCLALADTLRGGVLARDLADPIEAELEGGLVRVAARLPLRADGAWSEVLAFFSFGGASRR
jgi:hypothetical protein